MLKEITFLAQAWDAAKIAALIPSDAVCGVRAEISPRRGDVLAGAILSELTASSGWPRGEMADWCYDGAGKLVVLVGAPDDWFSAFEVAQAAAVAQGNITIEELEETLE